MEYALAHPPSSPATLERRRASRERRRQERERLAATGGAAAQAIESARIATEAARRASAEARTASAEAADMARIAREAAESGHTEANVTANDAERERQAPSNEEQPRPDDDRLSNVDRTQKSGSGSISPTNKKEEESKPKPLTDEELKAKKEQIEADQAKAYLNTVKAGLVKVSMQIIASCNSVAEENVDGHENETVHSENLKGTRDGDSKDVIIVVSNFLLDICSAHGPEHQEGKLDESNIATELLQQLKAKLDVKSPSSCQLKPGSEKSFANLLHASVVIFRALPKSRPRKCLLVI